MTYTILDSPCGPLTAVSDGAALVALSFGECPPSGAENGNDMIIDSLAGQLDGYFAGSRRAFDVPLKLYGAVFDQAVWAALASIPYGKIITYGALASAIGKPNACRAAGGACGRNPVVIVIPCHRVLGAGNGPWRKRLTGFGGGLAAKTMLLELEEKFYNA